MEKLHQIIKGDELVKATLQDASWTVKHCALVFSLALLIASPLAGLYTGDLNEILPGFHTILFSPCPLVTDYFMLGNLGATFLNAGLCGLSCTLLLYLLRVECDPSKWAGFFLVIAHGFYGLNFLNMWPPIFGIWLYCRLNKVSFGDNIGMAMFSTAFGPFVSELLFRYPVERQLQVIIAGVPVNLVDIILVLVLSCFLGFAIPAMLPGAQLLHRGFNLYNGGLAFGLLALFVYAFLYKTMGVSPSEAPQLANVVYSAHGNSYQLFANLFFVVVFLGCLVQGLHINDWSFKGYSKLLDDSGHYSDFFQEYGAGCTWINLGIYGLMMLVYFNIVVTFTEGAGFTGATFGVLLAAMTFAASGQHPKNVLPILLGYGLLSLLINIVCPLVGMQVPWSLSTQGYMNGVAFATGLCPFTGCYGTLVGIIAGAISAVICTTTSVMHGGFMLYNGGLTAGISALILLPMLDHYYTGKVRK